MDIDRNLLEKFGYSQEWIEYKVLDEEYFSSQVDDQANNGHEGFEHYRYGTFIYWIKSRNSASDKQVTQFLELAIKDSDTQMGGSAAVELLKSNWITDDQFEIICAECHQFGDWTEKHIVRYKLLRELHGSDLLYVQNRCLASGDSVVHEALLELAAIDEKILDGLSKYGANKRIRNIAKNRRKQT